MSICENPVAGNRLKPQNSIAERNIRIQYNAAGPECYSASLNGDSLRNHPGSAITSMIDMTKTLKIDGIAVRYLTTIDQRF